MIWLRVHIGGQLWQVHLVGPKSSHLLEGDDRHVGRCDYDKSRIYLSKQLGDDSREDALLHELLHALLFVTGAEGAYGGKPDVEEALIAALTPTLHRLLKDLGFRFPRYA